MIRSRAAQTPGVDLLLGHHVTRLVREAGRTVGVRASTPQGEREIRARLVVGAGWDAGGLCSPRNGWPRRSPPTATGRGDLDRSLAVYARRHRRRLRGHQSLAVDFAKARPFNPMERLVFSAAARDESVARHMYLFASRLIGPLRFLNPVALGKASAVNIKHRGAAASTAFQTHKMS
ncbi:MULTISPECIES: hypothetical protein [unclassified Streptomyces]|uniref:hypothetical protein n=1 Tax=unclassified Streptomyces TaxID=2593676 RepID=UPI00343C0D0C